MTTLNTVFSSFYGSSGKEWTTFKLSLMSLARTVAEINKNYDSVGSESLCNRINMFARKFFCEISKSYKISERRISVYNLLNHLTNPLDEIKKIRVYILQKLVTPRLIFPTSYDQLSRVEVYAYDKNFFESLEEEVKKKTTKSDLENDKRFVKEFLQDKITYDQKAKHCLMSLDQLKSLEEEEFWCLIQALKQEGEMEWLYIESNKGMLAYPITLLQNTYRLHQEEPELFGKNDLIQKIVVKFSDDIKETETKAVLSMTRMFVDCFKTPLKETQDNLIDFSSQVSQMESIIESSEDEEDEEEYKENVFQNPEIYSLGFKVYMSRKTQRDDFEYIQFREDFEGEIRCYRDLRDVVADPKKLSAWHEEFAVDLFKRLIHES